MRRFTRSALLCALLCFLVGATCIMPDDGHNDTTVVAEASSPPLDGDPGARLDATAIATVVKDVYNAEGGQRMIFLRVTGLDDATVVEVAGLLEKELGVRVRPESEADRTSLSLPVLTPVWSTTGQIGISISVDWARPDPTGTTLRVGVSFARSGLDGADIEYVLERGEQGWTIVQVILLEHANGAKDSQSQLGGLCA